MIHAIIDIGSNTVRMAVYQIKDGAVEQIMKKKDTTVGLASFMHDNVLEERGIKRLVYALEDFQKFLAALHIENISIFTTGALRNAANSREAIEELLRMGVQPVMLTGDNRRTANAVGAKLGLSAIVADVLPDGKEEVVRRLQEGGRTIMVGDGINDAPALTRADIGIAIGAGADIAMDAADVVLMKSSLKDVVAAIRLSRQVIRNIKENLFWAFFYNVIGIPLAAGLWLPVFGIVLSPMFGAAAMSLSSFCVVMNALRLNFFDVYDDRKGERKVLRELPGFLLRKEAGAEETSQMQADEKLEASAMKKTISIEGMMCGHCVAHVTKALEGMNGVEKAEVSLENKNAVVTLSADVSDKALSATIVDAGYEVVGIS